MSGCESPSVYHGEALAIVTVGVRNGSSNWKRIFPSMAFVWEASSADFCCRMTSIDFSPAVAAILDLTNLYFWPKGSTSFRSRCMLLKLRENCFVHVEISNVFGKSKMAAGRYLGIKKFRTSDEIFQFLLCQGICSSNFSQKAQSMRKLLTFW